MSTDYKCVCTVCPFYKSETTTEIKCEGIIDKSTISLIYKEKKDKDIQKMTFCEKRFKYCEVYEMLMKAKYSEDE